MFSHRVEEEKNICTLHPAADIIETADSFILKIELPGAKKENISATIEKSVLRVAAEKKPYFGAESRDVSEYRREFTLGDNVEKEKISAAFDAGVLTVTLGKKAQAAAREIVIS